MASALPSRFPAYISDQVHLNHATGRGTPSNQFSRTFDGLYRPTAHFLKRVKNDAYVYPQEFFFKRETRLTPPHFVHGRVFAFILNTKTTVSWTSASDSSVGLLQTHRMPNVWSGDRHWSLWENRLYLLSIWMTRLSCYTTLEQRPGRQTRLIVFRVFRSNHLANTETSMPLMTEHPKIHASSHFSIHA